MALTLRDADPAALQRARKRGVRRMRRPNSSRENLGARQQVLTAMDKVYAALDGAELTATQIAERTGVHRQHVVTCLMRLRDAGRVRRCGVAESATGVRREKIYTAGAEIIHREKHASPLRGMRSTPRQRSHSGSGQIVGPCYRRGLAGWGGFGNKS